MKNYVNLKRLVYELINLIKDYRKQMKQMISNVKEGDKHEQRN